MPSPSSYRDTGDIFMCRKHAALVGICVVDLPLAAIRLFTWAYYPTFEGFSPFLFKNICFIPIQFSRIRHVSLAAHLKARRQFKMELHSLLASQSHTKAYSTTRAIKQRQKILQNAAVAAAAAAKVASASASSSPPP
ncbi:transmembrane protein, partial [Cystoisospora suis]